MCPTKTLRGSCLRATRKRTPISSRIHTPHWATNRTMRRRTAMRIMQRYSVLLQKRNRRRESKRAEGLLTPKLLYRLRTLKMFWNQNHNARSALKFNLSSSPNTPTKNRRGGCRSRKSPYVIQSLLKNHNKKLILHRSSLN
jgi:hypothetical protein